MTSIKNFKIYITLILMHLSYNLGKFFLSTNLQETYLEIKINFTSILYNMWFLNLHEISSIYSNKSK